MPSLVRLHTQFVGLHRDSGLFDIVQGAAFVFIGKYITVLRNEVGAVRPGMLEIMPKSR